MQRDAWLVGSRCGLIIGAAALGALTMVVSAADGPPARKLLSAKDREVVLALMKATDAVQHDEAAPATTLEWEPAVLKTSSGMAYVPFRLTLADGGPPPKSAAVYVRAISRRDGAARTDEQSLLRPWVDEQGLRVTPWMPETVMLAPGEMPVSGPAAASVKRSIQNASQASTALALVTRARAKEKDDLETARPVLPFEEYYFVGPKSPRGSDPRAIERALVLKPGDYDVYVAMLDQTRKDTAPLVIRREFTVPDFWNDRLSLSTIMLVSDVHPLKVAFPPAQQAEHAYAFGQAEIVPVATSSFTQNDAITIVYQACNYGSPDSDLSADYTFYRLDGGRRPFNHTEPQQYDDAGLPPTSPWSSQAFLTQGVPLARFPVGQYELEVTLRDRLTRATATGRVSFSVIERK